MSHPTRPPNTWPLVPSAQPNQPSYIQTAISHVKHIERAAPSKAPLPLPNAKSFNASYYYLLLLCRRLYLIPLTPSIHVRRAITWLSTILPLPLPHPSVTIAMVYALTLNSLLRSRPLSMHASNNPYPRPHSRRRTSIYY